MSGVIGMTCRVQATSGRQLISKPGSVECVLGSVEKNSFEWPRLLLLLVAFYNGGRLSRSTALKILLRIPLSGLSRGKDYSSCHSSVSETLLLGEPVTLF